jgi:UDP-glucose 4-epimerase
MNKYLITGNKGYIGTELCKKIKKTPNTFIIGLDNNYFKKNNENNLSSVQGNIVDIQYNCDIRKCDLSFLKNVDCVIHLSAVSNDPIGSFFQKPTKEINLISSKRLFNDSIKHKVKNFVFASSCSIYGSSNLNIKTEDDSLDPLTDYAKSKVNFEKFINSKNKKINTTILRFSTACGLSENLRMDLVLNDFVMNAFFNKKIILNSSGNSFRPLIDVEDMCDAMIWASNRKQSETFNVGRNDNNILIIDLAKKIAKKQKNCKIVINPNAKTDKRSYQVSFNKVKKAGFYPKKNIDNIINGFFRFYSSNRLHNVYENENFFRLKVLKKLLKEKKINKNLEWM